MNYPYIVTELLLALRGGRASADLSKAAGYKFNQVNRWETGEKHLRWDEFCDYCTVLNVPIAKVLGDVFQYDRPELGEFLHHLYSFKFPLYSVAELAEKLHRHPTAIRRYLDGEIYPDLEFVLAFMDLDVNRLSNFISAILPAECDSPLRRQIENTIRIVASEGQYPIAAAIEGWLSTRVYQDLEKHDNSFIAERVGCSAEEVGRILSLMLDAGSLAQDETGKYKTTYTSIDMSGLHPKSLSNMCKFWHEQTARYYSKGDFSHRGPVVTRGMVRVAPVSQKTSREINDILLRTNAEIQMALEKGDEMYDDVRVILFGSLSTLDCL